MIEILNNIIKYCKVNDFTSEADLKYFIAKTLETQLKNVNIHFEVPVKYREKKLRTMHIDMCCNSEKEKTYIEFKFNRYDQRGSTQARKSFKKDIGRLNKLKIQNNINFNNYKYYVIFVTDVEANYKTGNNLNKPKESLKNFNLSWEPIEKSNFYYTIKEI